MKVKLVMAVLDIVPRSIDWTDKEIHEFCYEIGSAGVDMVRIMYWPLKDYPAPFKKYTEGYDLRQWDKVWWHQLQRVRRIINTWKMGIYFDLFDHCGTKEATRDINPWYNNINNVNGIYDTSPRALGLYKKWVSKVVRDIGLRGWRYNPLGIKVKTAYNWFGLGNELTFKGTERKEWAQLWGYGLAEHLRSLGYKQKLLWSGEEQTAHALRGWISPENDVIPGGSIYGFNDTVIQYHGMDYWINAEGLLKTITRKRWIAFSDDGTNIKSDVEKGICV